MLRVVVQLVPSGFEPLARTIATMEVANISDLADMSSYYVTAIEESSPLTGAPRRSISAEIKDHLRRQTVWKLVAKAAEAVATAPEAS